MIDFLLIVMVFGALFYAIHLQQPKRNRHQEVLQRTAETEHVLGWVPHKDPDIRMACIRCDERSQGTDLTFRMPFGLMDLRYRSHKSEK